VPEVNEENFAAIEQDEWEVVDKYSTLHEKVESAKEYLLSLSEMKIVYLFKSLEVVLKRLIQVAYPKANIKELYQWEKLEVFLKNRDINITILDGHVDAVQLRLVNNAIKHNGIINEEIKKIPEFKTSSEFNYITLGAFYDRIKPTIENFFRQIRNKVEEDLYDFPLERLLSLAEEYYERMDDRTFFVFIEKLKEKLNRNSNTFWPGDDQIADDIPF
jgi:hypothetical protein